MSYKSHASGPARMFDHLYDPLYTTSGIKDIWRQNHQALNSTAPVHIYPVYRTMFTDLPRWARNFYTLDQNPLPHLAPYGNFYATDGTGWDHCQRFNKSANVERTDHVVMDGQWKSTKVTGTDRAKFFNIPLTNTKTISLKLNIPKDLSSTKLQQNDSAEKKPKWKTIGCQTIYREQSAQTRPWKPPAIISSDCIDTPEIIDVADMLEKNDEINGNLNSPHEPGLYEAMLVERSRKRRDWERSLPLVTSTKEWLKRRVVLEAFEWNDWIGRERNIEYCQKLRLGIVKKMMADRKADMLSKSKERLNMTISRIDQLKEMKLKNLRIKHQRKLRKLELEHKNISKKYVHVDVATEYINKASDLYGPQKRFGVHPKHRHFMAHKTNYEARLEGLHRLQAKPIEVAQLIKQKADLSKPKGQITEIKRGFWDEKCLGKIYNELTLLRFQLNPPNELFQCLKYIEHDVSLLLSTPLTTARNIEVDNEEHYQMCLTMQKLIKGRAIQKIVYKGREKYRELINELQSTHQLEAVREMFKQNKQTDENSLMAMRNLAYQQQLEQTMLHKAESSVQEVIDQAKGTTVSFILEMLDKELLRLAELKKAHAISILVENERYRREARDAVRRKKVNKLRQKDQEILQSVRDTRQKTVTEYLETVLLQHMDCLSQKMALDEIRQITRKIDQEAEEISDVGENEKIVAEIVNHFVLPKVFQRIAIDNYLDDIRTTIFGDPVEPDRSIQLQRFIENSLSPRQLPPLPIIPSAAQSLSSLDDSEDEAHHEAMKAIGNALQNAFNVIDPPVETPPIHSTGVYEILDDIVNGVVATGLNKSTVDGQLQSILVGVTDDLYGLMANEMSGCDDLFEDVIQSAVPKKDDDDN